MTSKQYIGIAIVLVIVVGLTWWVLSAPPSTLPTPQAISTATSTTATSTGTATVNNNEVAAQGASTAKIPVASPKASVSHPTAVTLPASGAQWVLGAHNTIQWNAAANISGGIYLVNASNGTVVGWILQQSGPAQDSFSWNTRDLLISRTSTGITVPVGTYVIKVMFDSPEDPTIASAPFSIIAPNQAQIPTYDVSIAHDAFSVPTLTVQRGGKIIFTNNDVTSYQILVSSYSPFTISGGSSFTFDTTSLSPGPYAFYSSANPTLRLNVTVQ